MLSTFFFLGQCFFIVQYYNLSCSALHIGSSCSVFKGLCHLLLLSDNYISISQPLSLVNTFLKLFCQSKYFSLPGLADWPLPTLQTKISKPFNFLKAFDTTFFADFGFSRLFVHPCTRFESLEKTSRKYSIFPGIHWYLLKLSNFTSVTKREEKNSRGGVHKNQENPKSVKMS